MHTRHDISKLRNIALAAILSSGVAMPSYACWAWADEAASQNAASSSPAQDVAGADAAGASAKDSATTSLDADERETSVVGRVAEKVSLASLPDDLKPVKDETVYVFADAKGEAYETLVKDQIMNAPAAEELFDSSTLRDIAPEDSDISFAADGQAITWKALGEGVSYQGTTDRACPVTMTVSFQLDGADIAPSDLAGKSGHVKIRFDFKNNSTCKARIGGKDQTIYTPFVAITGFSLDNDRFSHVEVTNAKAMAGTGETTIAGYVMPGMQENLALSKEDFEFPSYFEVEADVTDFKLAATTTIVTNSLFADADTAKLDEEEDLGDLDAMTDAMGALIDGSSTLYDGLAQLATGAGALDGGLGELGKATSELPDGLDALATNLDELSSGAQQVNAGIQSAAQGGESLEAGAEDLQGALELAASAAQQIGEAALTPASGAVQAASGSIDAAKTSLAGADVTSAVADAQGAASGANEAKASLQGLLDSDTLSEEDAATVQGAIESLDAAAGSASAVESDLGDVVGAINAASTSLDEASGSLNGASEAIAGAQDALTGEGGLAQSLALASTGTDSLAQGAHDLNAGLGQIAQGTQGLQDGSTALSNGAHQLADAAPALVEGIVALKAGSAQLSVGMNAAADGSLQLSSGLQQFNDEAVSKIVDAYDENLGGLSDHLKATVDAAKRYDNFSGKDPSMTGSVKFIYETDSIG